MKNKILFLSTLLSGCLLFFAACEKTPDSDSIVQPTSVPYIGKQFIEDFYVYGTGNVTIMDDVPDIVAIAVDTILGFEGGYGGKTGSDSIQIKKSEILEWPVINGAGTYSISFQKFNRGNFKIILTSAIIVLSVTNDNPGPTNLQGSYLRAASNYVLNVKKALDGVYIVDNPGGAATVAPFVYLLFNYKSSSGNDSLDFPIQPNPCGGGLQLVSPNAPAELPSSDYSAQYPPQITSTAPLTLSWKVFTFDEASPISVQPGAGVALCQWGSGSVRTFIKQ